MNNFSIDEIFILNIFNGDKGHIQVEFLLSQTKYPIRDNNFTVDNNDSYNQSNTNPTQFYDDIFANEEENQYSVNFYTKTRYLVID